MAKTQTNLQIMNELYENIICIFSLIFINFYFYFIKIIYIYLKNKFLFI